MLKRDTNIKFVEKKLTDKVYPTFSLTHLPSCVLYVLLEEQFSTFPFGTLYVLVRVPLLHLCNGLDIDSLFAVRFDETIPSEISKINIASIWYVSVLHLNIQYIFIKIKVAKYIVIKRYSEQYLENSVREKQYPVLPQTYKIKSRKTSCKFLYLRCLRKS